MLGHYIYGIVESQRDFPPDIPGLDGTPVYLIPWRNLAAVVGDAPLRGYPADLANTARHGAVVEEIMQGGPILPMRFGTLLGERQRVVTMLAEHSGAFEEALCRLRGRVEMGLKVLWEADLPVRQRRTIGGQAVKQAGLPAEDPVCVADAIGRSAQAGGVGARWDEPADPPAGPGSRYLLRRLEEERRTEAVRARGETLIQAIQATLRPLADEWTLQRFPTPRLLLDAAYLVPRDALQAFRDGVDRIEEPTADLRFLLSGPWPPYSFVRLSLNQDRRENP